MAIKRLRAFRGNKKTILLRFSLFISLLFVFYCFLLYAYSSHPYSLIPVTIGFLIGGLFAFFNRYREWHDYCVLIAEDRIIMRLGFFKIVIKWNEIEKIIEVSDNGAKFLLKNGKKNFIIYKYIDKNEKDALIRILHTIIEEKKPPAEAVALIK